MEQELSRMVAKLVWDSDALKVAVERPFEMASGRLSPFYIDCRLLISFPLPRQIITDYAAWLCGHKGLHTDYIAGGATAGIPFAAWLADRMHMPFVYVRKAAKGYGRTAQVEGRIEPGNTVLLYEDLITDGKSKLNFLNGIRNAGCSVAHCLVVFDRQEDARQLLAAEAVELHALVTLDECLAVGVAEGRLTENQFERIQVYRQTGEI